MPSFTYCASVIRAGASEHGKQHRLVVISKQKVKGQVHKKIYPTESMTVAVEGMHRMPWALW